MLVAVGGDRCRGDVGGRGAPLAPPPSQPLLNVNVYIRSIIERSKLGLDERHEIIVRDMHNDKAAEEAEAYGIRTVPAVVVDGFLLACCKNKGPTLQELHAAGLAKPGTLRLESA